MLTPMLPTVVKLAGCPLGGRPFLIQTGKLEHEKPSRVAVLGTQTIPLSKALKYFGLARSPAEWHTYIHKPCLKA
jgi:hypothetical protein